MSDKFIKRIDRIPALPELSTASEKKQRVAVYARVSTDHEEQQSSLAAQKDYYAKLIDAHEDWTLAEIFADDGVTGTSYLQRREFQRMMQACEDGKVDRIVTKSISRFARNTVDALNAIRKLKSLGIGVYFEKEAIWTLDSKGEFLITLMTSLAQEESRSISENVTWGHRKRFADGKYSCAYSRFLGYDDGYMINDEEAVTVRLIYKLFLQGFTCHTIAQKLTEADIPSPGGAEQWHATTVNSILTNEKYKGDALLQKQFTVDFLGHKVKKNEGEVTQYYVENGHEAIIAPWLFDYVQERKESRKELDSRYRGATYFESRLICGKCGATYGRKPEHSNDKYRQDIWMCNDRFKKGKYCKNTRIDDKDMDALICEIAKRFISRITAVRNLCEKVCTETGNEDVISHITHYRKFKHTDIEDLSIILDRIEVFPRNKLCAVLIDGSELMMSWRRHAKPVKKEKKKPEHQETDLYKPCQNCGIPVFQMPKKKPKQFCCDRCRIVYWHKNRELTEDIAEKCVCKNCGKAFMALKSQRRKYCGHECYIAERFGKSSIGRM